MLVSLNSRTSLVDFHRGVLELSFVLGHMLIQWFLMLMQVVRLLESWLRPGPPETCSSNSLVMSFCFRSPERTDSRVSSWRGEHLISIEAITRAAVSQAVSQPKCPSNTTSEAIEQAFTPSGNLMHSASHQLSPTVHGLPLRIGRSSVEADALHTDGHC